MSRFLFFWLFTICSLWTSSQNLHFAEHTLEDYTKNIVSVNSKSFYLERDGYHCNLVGIDQNGNRIFKKTFTGSMALGNSLIPIKIITTLEKNLLVLYNGEQDGCDYLIFRNLHFQLLDTIGNMIFTNSLLSTTINPLYEGQAFDGVQASDSTYYLTVRNELYHYSKSGLFISKKNLTINNIYCVSILNNGNLFVNGTFQNAVVNAELDTSGNQVTNPVPSVILKKLKQSTSGKTYALTQSGTLVRYSPQYLVLNQANVSGNVYTDFVFLNDTIYATGYISSIPQPFYVALNEHLGIIYHTSSPLKGIYPSGISLNDQNKVNIVATGHNKFGPYTSISNPAMAFRNYYQLPKTGNFKTGADVGVISYQVMDALNINLHDFQMDAEVEIKNFGTQAVNGFYLISKKYTYYCEDTYRKWVDTLLLPGQTVKVKTGWQALRGDYYFAQIQNQKRWICFYTSIPDSMADSEPANDRFCDSVSVLPTVVAERGSLETRIRIFPNPFTSFFTIQSEFEIREITVFNALGLAAYNQSYNLREAVLDLQGLESGVYFLRIDTEMGLVTKKLIKQ